MSRYLSALKISENVGVTNLKNLNNLPCEFQKVTCAEPKEPKKPTFASSLGSLGSSPAPFPIKKASNSTDVDVDNAVHFRWLIHYTDRDPVITTFSPEVNHAGALAYSQGAVAAVPVGKESMRRISGVE